MSILIPSISLQQRTWTDDGQIHQISFKSLSCRGGSPLKCRKNPALRLRNPELCGFQGVGGQRRIDGMKQLVEPRASQTRHRDRAGCL